MIDIILKIKDISESFIYVDIKRDNKINKKKNIIGMIEINFYLFLATFYFFFPNVYLCPISHWIARRPTRH